MHFRIWTFFSFLIFLAAVSRSAFAEEWSQFHGPNGHGYVANAEIPTSWSDDDYVWRVKLQGEDVGSPSVFGDRVFLLAADPTTASRSVMAFDLKSGRSLWERSFSSKPHHLHTRNTYAASTPTVDSDYIYVAWSEPEHTFLKCFTHEGEEVWSRDFGTWQSQHGFGTSPALIDGKVVLYDSQQADQLNPGEKPGQSRMLALDRRTGKTIWETPLTTTRVCYGMPALYQPPGQPKQIVATSDGDGAFSLDAETGELLWKIDVFRTRCVSSPIVVDDLVIGSAGSGGGGNHLVAVRFDGDKAEEVYRIERAPAPYVPTSAVAEGLMYSLGDSGFVSCVDVKTGKVYWSERIGGPLGPSPVVLGDKLLVISLRGTATVIAADKEFKKLSSFELGGNVGATPAYSNGYLLLRVGDELRCLGPDAA